MYGKLFASMYEGTLYGQWQAIVTLQQLVILADADGVVDMTPPAIAARTSIPLEIIEAGLSQLSEVDRYSRTPTEDGRRIVLVDEERPWGWRIVNYRYYRDLASREDKKAKDRERIRLKRGEASGYDGPLTGEDCSYCGAPATGVDHIIPRSMGGQNTDLNTTPACNRCNSSKRDRYLDDFLNDSTTTIDKERVLANPKLTRLVAFCRNSSRFVADVAHTDTDINTKNTTAGSRPRHEYPPEFEAAWGAYPKRTGDNPKGRALKAWNARRAEGHSAEELADGVSRYARFCNATNKTGTELVKQAATFFGPDKAFLETWQTAPKQARGFVG